jgi:hypothetical protein
MSEASNRTAVFSIDQVPTMATAKDRREHWDRNYEDVLTFALSFGVESKPGTDYH